MSDTYAKVIVKGSPISKSNFKLFNIKGRAILPYNSGKYHDRYALYEEEIAYEARAQNPNTILNEALIAVLKVYYKSQKRHPDTNNITKSIFDGIEKSGLIVNDAQIRKLIIEEFYDNKFPRFELELFAESSYCMNYNISPKKVKDTPVIYEPPSNKKNLYIKNTKAKTHSKNSTNTICQICNKSINKENSISANNGKIIICKDCFTKLF
ncbi:Endodeoxyribonuclease RusA [Clostridium sp. USBA 49]|jgi:Holliday junction resolvase RusA-like endonuclease|uniref:RusA family crossover junction endodeoxyribonuclease n=1 Tax=Clostridium sp. USBA 49 TaxID=1881060 RepID=UPI000999958F|nr:RusA family crossover junction endodeoxyribonuclease [Clostridium sp. USBA 49]SKA80951.1 Endodeoxyribonuclease RusA [Clostridium sp. USBA 49]